MQSESWLLRRIILESLQGLHLIMAKPAGRQVMGAKHLEKLDGALLGGMMAEMHRTRQASLSLYSIAREAMQNTESQSADDNKTSLCCQHTSTTNGY